MRVKIWGCRGSIAVPGSSTLRYGGNTSCYQLTSNKGSTLILDAGTGMRNLGAALIKETPLNIPILISHTHYDHVMGYPFFSPFYIPENSFDVFGPSQFNSNFQSVLTKLMNYSFFPVRLDELSANLKFHDLQESTFTTGEWTIQSFYTNHPVTSLAYRVTCDGKTIVYTGDTEPYRNHLKDDPEAKQCDIDEIDTFIGQQEERWRSFLSGADLCLYDSQYTIEEYPRFIGWGHSSMEIAINNCKKAGVSKLALTHHDPNRTDDQIDQLHMKLQALDNKGMDISFAHESDVIEL